MVVILSLLCFLGAFAGYSNNLVIPLNFSENKLVHTQEKGYDLMELKEERCLLAGSPGEPWLPSCMVPVLLPQGTKVSDVYVRVLKETRIAGNYNILPAQKCQPFSDPKHYDFINPDPGIYQSHNPFPAALARHEATSIIRGYHVAIIRVNPLAFIPNQKQVFLREKIELDISLEPLVAKGGMSYSKEEPIFRDMVIEDVMNPEQTASYSFGDSSGKELLLDGGSPGEVKYLLITHGGMWEFFEALVEWKTRKGVPAEMVYTEDIETLYTGSDLQAKIKNCIRDYVQNKGTLWVALGGDINRVPDRDCYGKVTDGNPQMEDYTIPTDQYYSELDSDWDSNGNGVYGEIEDNIDLGADVFVGRLPAMCGDGATAMINKIIFYETEPFAPYSFTNKMLLSCGSGVYGEEKSEIIWNSYVQPFWADGVKWRFYDTDTDFPGGPDYDVDPAHINEQLCNGYNFMHMHTHGGRYSWQTEIYNENYTKDHALAVNNLNLFPHILTSACLTNAFDTPTYHTPCLGEAFMRNPNGGAVTYIGCSRVNWDYLTQPILGPGLEYDGIFYLYLFQEGILEHPRHIGAVFAKTKQYFVGRCNSYITYRWIQFALNLLGDPEIRLHTTGSPGTFSPVYDSDISMGKQTYCVETGAPEALVCLSKNEEVYAYGNADGSGHFEAEIEPLSPGNMSLVITAMDYAAFQGNITVWDNDECEYAMILENADTRDLSLDLPGSSKSSDPFPGCAGNPDPGIVDAWYKLIPGLYKQITITMDADTTGTGFIVYSGSCGNLVLEDCSQGDPQNGGASFQFSITAPPEKDYYIRVYGTPGTGGSIGLNWEIIMQGNECFNPMPIGCGDLFDIDHPVPGIGTDQMPCISSYSNPISGQWFELFVPAETAATVGIFDYDLGQYVGIAFYEECGDPSSPFDSICDWEQVSLTYQNSTEEPITVKVLVNFCVWCMQPRIDVSCEPYYCGQDCSSPQIAQCMDNFDIDNPIPGRGEDELPCMQGSPHPSAGQWLELTLTPNFFNTVTVYDWDLGQKVGVGFYEECGDIANPLDCRSSQVFASATYANVTDENVTVKALVNFCTWCMQPNIYITCEETRPGQFCTGARQAQCETIFDQYNPIEGVGNDLLPCMAGYQGMFGARWIDFTIPAETILNISVEGYDSWDIVGAGFYEGCGDLSSPLNSGCGEGTVSFSWDNPSPEPLPLKILVNSPLSGGHPEISLFCMPYH